MAYTISKASTQKPLYDEGIMHAPTIRKKVLLYWRDYLFIHTVENRNPSSVYQVRHKEGSGSGWTIPRFISPLFIREASLSSINKICCLNRKLKALAHYTSIPTALNSETSYTYPRKYEIQYGEPISPSLFYGNRFQNSLGFNEHPS